MANEIKFESVFAGTQASKTLDQMHNGSVVFEFYNNVAPIACDLDYLYAQSDQALVYDVENAEAGIDRSYNTPVVYVEPNFDVVNHKNRAIVKYCFLDVIKNLSFKYGLKHEYYKNKYGRWIDMGAIRPYFGLNSTSENIFQTFYNGIIDDNYKETSIYYKVCDNQWFEFATESENDPYRRLCEIKDLNVIPEVDYIVKDYSSNCGFKYHITRGDGTYIEDYCEKIPFICIENDSVELANKTDAVRFSYKLVSMNNQSNIPIGNYENNNHHLFEDLILTFTNPDGTPYTDLVNLFITCNGLFVDYRLVDDNTNQIYIPNVVKFANYQHKSIKSTYNVDTYTTIRKTDYGKRIIDIDIPEEGYGTNYSFDIKIIKWKGVKVSHFESPNTTGRILKYEKTDPNHSYWLENSLKFSKPVIKDKTILLCGNTIIDKRCWTVDEYGNIQLLTVADEFDILYSEVHAELKQYLTELVGHSLNGPKLEDYVTAAQTPEEIEAAYERYYQDVEKWMLSTGSDNYHYSVSPFNVVVSQFIDRKYNIIRFDSENESDDYVIKVSENTDDIILNKPLRNSFINKNWSSEDIVVFNGLAYEFVNLYENVFTAPLTWYRPSNIGTLEGAYAFKLEVSKHYNEHDKFRKMTFEELLAGPSEYRDYYVRNDNNMYMKLTNVTEFEHIYNLVSEDEMSQPMDPRKTYFTKNGNEYQIVPKTTEVFDPNVKYYTCKFTKEYYIKK